VTATATGGAHRRAPATPVPDPAGSADAVRRVRRIGYAVLGLQLIGFMIWSQLLSSRFALTIDFAEYENAWFLIAHGHLDPLNTVGNGVFWRNHSEFIMWPLALLYWLWPHQVTLLWIQDAGVVAAEAVAFTWLCEIAASRRPAAGARWLAATGLVLLVADPWIWWSVSFDFHTESLFVPLLMLLARDLANGRRRAWLWVVPLVACGDVADTYLVGIGIATMLVARGRRMTGAAVAAVGAVATGFVTLIHGNLGSASAIQAYSYLAGAGPAMTVSTSALIKAVASHPLSVIKALWGKRTDIWASIAPAGVLGLGFIWILPIVGIILLEDNLDNNLVFARPSFQSLAVYILVPVGSIWALAAMRSRRWAAAAAAILLIQTVGWSVIWAPQVPVSWLRVSAASAGTLARVSAAIPNSATVISSEGIVGRFAGRPVVESEVPSSRLRAIGLTWVVVTPTAGIEVQTVAGALAFVAELARMPGVRLEAHANGVWAFSLRAPASGTALSVPATAQTLPAWASPGPAGRPVLAGPVSRWHATSTGKPGYVAAGLEWRVRTGTYTASAELSSSGPVNVEVWDNTGGVLLARRIVPASSHPETVTFPVDAATHYQPSQFSGWGPFRADMIPPPPGQRLEIRVWSPGHETVNVYTASLQRDGS
jgi:uncharacterized membrane protein